MKWKFLYPILWINDLLFFGDLKARKGVTDYDNMLAQQLLYANTTMPTYFSQIALKKYLQTDWRQRIMAYHSPERNGIVPLGELIAESRDEFSAGVTK